VQWRNSRSQYGLVAQLLHWGIVVLVATQLVIGVRAADLPFSMARLQLLAQHKSLGMTVLMLMALRLGWRLLDRPPELVEGPDWSRTLARLTHWGFYVLLLAVPVSGWILSSASNLSVSWFRLFTWPDLVAADPALADAARTTHNALVILLVAMVVLHAVAALAHQLVWRDGVLLRMLPRRAGGLPGPRR
jgi:cytochrome b561